MTLRFRLTFWHTILLTVVLLIFAFGFHFGVARVLYGQVDEALRSQAEQVAAVFENTIDPALGQLLSPTIVLSAQFFAQVSSPDGAVIDRSFNLNNQSLPVPTHTREINRQGQAGFYNWLSDGTRMRVYSAPVRSPAGNVVASVQVGQSLASIDSMLRVSRLALLVGCGWAVLLAALGGALLTGRALQPLNQIADTTSRIARAEDLSQRIEGDYSNDEIGQLAATFNDMMTRLQLLFNTQQRLVADVSHELRTPLATIQGNVDLLRRGAGKDPAMQQESMDAINAEVARMSRLVRDLLLLAEADAGVRLTLKPLELDTLLLEVYREALWIAGGRVKIRLGHEDQAQVLGDADRLKQLLLNLVNNAIAYTPPNGVITLSLHRRPDGWVRVTISDTGIGISPQDLPHIFDRFWRVDRARSRMGGGSGLGLSIAKSIIEAHGGSITVHSLPGEGSTFEVLMPQSHSSSF